MKRVYVWEFPVKVTHWLNFLSILTLSITGYYIGAPFTNDVSMGQMRFFHFIAAYVFTASVLVRIYWWFAGNKYARIDQFVPTTKERWKNFGDTFLFYLFLKKDLPHSPGHTAIAGLTYFFLLLLFLLSILTGFALYSQGHAGVLWKLMGGWFLSVMNEGTIRLIHHGIMWVIVPFLILHIYISWHNERVEKNGLISSIFSGYKTLED